MPAPRPPGGFPVDEFPTAPSTPPRGPELIDPWKVNLQLLLTLFNVATNRYKDNKKDDDKDKCKIYSFKDKETECPNGRSHHIAPDRSWRSPGTRGQTTGKPSISTLVDAMLEDFLPGRGGGFYYADKMDEKNGQCICVSVSDHIAIHEVHYLRELALGELATPQWTATLEKLEGIDSDSVALITGCDGKK